MLNDLLLHLYIMTSMVDCCSANGIMSDRKGAWHDDHTRPSQPAIGWKKNTAAIKKTDMAPPASIGWSSEVMPPHAPPPLGQVDMDRATYGNDHRDTGHHGRRSPSPYRHETTRTSRHRPQGNKKGSRSLPSSPVKKQLTSPVWRPERDDNTKVKDGPNMKRTISFPNTRSVSPADRRSADKKTRYHKGAYYEEVDTMAVAEKETVL